MSKTIATLIITGLFLTAGVTLVLMDRLELGAGLIAAAITAGAVPRFGEQKKAAPE